MSSSALIKEGRASGLSGSALVFPATVFLGALLLFAVEPMIAKMILPWFGGAAEVWIVCLLFFQVALLTGYLYAHLLRRWLTPEWQRMIHLGLLLLSLGALPVMPSAAWKPVNDGAPLWQILGLLTGTIGPPYVLLAATSPLMQSWWAQERGGAASPYRLFALSNAGSLLALLAYPVAVEPFLATDMQARLWSVLYVAFVAFCGATGWLTRGVKDTPSRTSAVATSSVSGSERLVWFALSACGSALLMAITNHLSQNVAAIPLLWVLPLTLYLLSFILCFDSDRWYRRGLFYVLFIELVPAMVYAAGGHHANSALYVLLPLFLVGLFVVCMVCQGELAAMRPSSDRLTGYYLIIAAGGGTGGIFVGAIAPAIFPALYELPLTLCATAALAFTIGFRRVWPFDRRGRVIVAFVGIVWLATSGLAIAQARADARSAVVQVRNFYGALQVLDLPARGTAQAARRLMHGTIEHGAQLADPAHAMIPTTYYSRNSGVGLAIAALQRHGPLHIGVIGLGAGTLVAYGRPGDTFRFYETDPQVIDIARRDFSFLRRSPARADIVLGDGRLRLEAEPAQKFDLLVIDAFSGDAIPVHLLTAEAFVLYAQHLAPGGVIAVHVSNQYLDLLPVVAAGAARLDMVAQHVASGGDASLAINPADWMLVAKPTFFGDPIFAAMTVISAPDRAAWTDDYSNLWRRLK